MPVYSSHLLRYEQLKIGEQIRNARQRSGMTLKQLAARMDSSAARLSQVENDQIWLDLKEVLAFSSVLDLSMDELLPPDIILPFQIVRDGEPGGQPLQPMLRHGHGDRPPLTLPHSFRPLADLFMGRHMEPVLGRIEPVADGFLQFCHHHEEEFAFVLHGHVEFRIKTPEGDRREELSRGDCVYFRSHLPHSFCSLDDGPAETLQVFSSPSASSGAGVERKTLQAIAHDDAVDSGDLLAQVGEKLRLLREVRGWTVDDVAQASGLAERHVHGIERGHRALPVDAVLKLARAFGKPLREVIGLTVPRRPYYVLQRSADIPALPTRRRRTPVERPSAPASKTCQPLIEGFGVRGMYPCFLRMLNVGLETLTLHEHHGEEFIYVLEGELELTTYSGENQVKEVLRAGDSCYIDSTVPHLLRSWTRNPYSETSAEVIDVFWCPLGMSYMFDT
jgi:transcriptional regulator with XRE-family HTH domain/quercetin dioxygenase-like cupin family protein